MYIYISILVRAQNSFTPPSLSIYLSISPLIHINHPLLLGSPLDCI